MEPVKIGIIGVGGMGGTHCRAVDELEESCLVAVADVNPDTANAVGAQYGAKPFTDYKTLIDEGGVEAIAIVTPHFLHPPIAEYAASRGVHVLSEKPIAVTVGAARQMVKTCHDAGVLLGVMLQQRKMKWRQKMHEIVHSGELGDLFRISLSAHWYRTQAYYNSGAWRGTWKGEGGGVLMNQAPHSLDQFLWIGGQPQSVQAVAITRLHEIEVENTVLAVCDYGNGMVGNFHVSTAEPQFSERIEVVGDKGALIFEEGKLRRANYTTPLSKHLRETPERFGDPGHTWSELEVGEENEDAFVEVHRAFANAVRANDPSLLVASGEDGLRALELGNAMLLSGYTRREVKLPLAEGVFETMLEKLQNGTKPEELRG